MLTLEQAVSCNTLADFLEYTSTEKVNFYWQKQETDFVYTYDKLPDGVMADYYGKDIDLVCPGAWAFRSRIWPSFSFKEALGSNLFSVYDMENVSYNFWKENGVADFLCIISGRPGLSSFSFFAFDHVIPNPIDIALPYRIITQKLDLWLEHHTDLVPYSREFTTLSKKEREVIKLQINHPNLSHAQQANILKISVNTLREKQKRISKKFGVSNFSSAVLIAERSREFYWPL